MDRYYIDAISILLGWVGLAIVTIATMRAREQETRRRLEVLELALKQQPHDYIPRSECELALRNIVVQTNATHELLKAFIYSGGDHGVAIRALEAAAVDEAWIDDYLQHVCPLFEGSIAWMYLDTHGLVTVADGIMLPNAAAACALPFRRADGQLATAAEIAADFARVHVMDKAHVAHFYRCPTSLILSSEDMLTLGRAKCHEFVAQLRAMFPGFDTWPSQPKQGVLDMAYNLGIGRSAGPGRPRATGLHEFGHLIAALSQMPPAFGAAAGLCERVGPGPERNHWTAQQFLAGVTA